MPSAYQNFIKQNWDTVSGPAPQRMKALAAKWRASGQAKSGAGKRMLANRDKTKRVASIVEADEDLQMPDEVGGHKTGLKGGKLRGGSLGVAAAVDPLGSAGSIVGYGCQACTISGDGFIGDLGEFGGNFAKGLIGAGPDRSIGNVGRQTGKYAASLGKAGLSLAMGNPIGVVNNLGNAFSSVASLF